MKSVLKSGFLITTLMLAGTGAALAQDGGRVQQEVITINDPTQSSSDSWRFQAGAEYWYMNMPDPRFHDLGLNGTVNGGIAGFSGYASRNDWTIMVAVRPGAYGEQLSGNGLTVHNHMGVSEYEVKARYLLRDEDWLGFTPYILGGFHSLRANNQFTYLATPNTYLPWYNEIQNYNTAEAGLGGMRPFGEDWGMRIDASIGAAFGNDKSQIRIPTAGPIVTSSADGVGYNGYLTIYYRATQNLVLNFGGRAGYIDARSSSGAGPGSLAALGVFASVAYSFDN